MSLKIKKETAQKLYVESPEWFKEQLVEEFGEACFKAKSFDDIKTFEDACTELEINPGSVFNYQDSPDEIAYKKLKVIAKAINRGWTPDWSDSNQYKYYPYFRLLSSGFGFSVTFYDVTGASTLVGSRLCFESSEKSKYAGTQFIDLYKEFLL